MGEESGAIWIEDGEVYYDSGDYGSWRFPLSNLRVFGEYTNDQGPWMDDWFMVFVSSRKRWFEASVYADSRDRFRKQLAAALGVSELRFELAASTDFASRIIWPVELRGQPLFQFTYLPQSWWRRLLGLRQVRIELSGQAKETAT